MIEELNKMSIKFDNVFAQWDQGIKGMSETFLNNIKKILTSKLMDQLSKVFSQGGAGSKLFGKLLGFPEFAHGGSFTVGGKGGTDSNVVAFRASKGETVTISKPGQSGASIVFHNTYDFSGSTLSEGEVRAMIDRSQKITVGFIHNEMQRNRF